MNITVPEIIGLEYGRMLIVGRIIEGNIKRQ